MFYHTLPSQAGAILYKCTVLTQTCEQLNSDWAGRLRFLPDRGILEILVLELKNIQGKE